MRSTDAFTVWLLSFPEQFADINNADKWQTLCLGDSKKFIFMCFACMSVCVVHAWLVAEETGRGCVISWNWSYRHCNLPVGARQIPGTHMKSQMHNEQMQCQYFYSEMGEGERESHVKGWSSQTGVCSTVAKPRDPD